MNKELIESTMHGIFRQIYLELLDNAPEFGKLLDAARLQGQLTRKVPCCQYMAERMRQKTAEAQALSTLRDRGFKLSPAQAAKANACEMAIYSPEKPSSVYVDHGAKIPFVKVKE